MRISLGLSAARSCVLGSRASASVAARSERRDNSVMTTSMRLNLDRGRAREGRLMKAGFFARRHWRGGGPRALAAFVKRPQAACSNRRYIYFLGSPTRGVNENYLLYLGGAIGIIFILARRPDIPLSSYSSGGGYGSPQQGPRDASVAGAPLAGTTGIMSADGNGFGMTRRQRSAIPMQRC